MYLKTLGHNLIWYKYSSSDNGWGSGMVSCNHISLPMLLIKAFVIMSGKKLQVTVLLLCVLLLLALRLSNQQSDFQILKYMYFLF